MLFKTRSVVHGTPRNNPHLLPLLLCVVAAIASIARPLLGSGSTHAASCPDLKILFARGSGAERYNNSDYQAFKASLETKLSTTNLTYKIDDLDYPAIGISGDKISVALGALISGGEAYQFGDSVKQGINAVTSQVNSSTCKSTKYVIAGYSQGAMVVSGALQKLNPNQLIYAATFGDPKLYLPEGSGPLPSACKGENLSDYRVYVPDCYAHKGLLGAREPYSTPDYSGKVGVWCNKFDIFCSSHYSLSSHISYDTDNLYEDASRFIFSKIAATFNFQNEHTSPHDTAILIDSSGSMQKLIEGYKQEAHRLAIKTLDAGGRIALYDYRDLDDPYQPVERCNFNTCTIESFQAGLDQIEVDGGGDAKESLLSASLHVMQSLNWRLGSTKSLIILTDAGYHSPDRDGTTFYDVKTLSKQIDPVNFYIITTPKNLGAYRTLAKATDGAVASTLDDLSILTDNIIARYDSLPRVEEDLESGLTIPHLEIISDESLSSSEHRVVFASEAEATIVILNDSILGTTDQTKITLTGLDSTQDNVLTLVPLSDTVRGEPISIQLSSNYSVTYQQESTTTSSPNASPIMPIPKAPNTGRL